MIVKLQTRVDIGRLTHIKDVGFGGMKDVDKVHNEKSPVVADRTLTI